MNFLPVYFVLISWSFLLLEHSDMVAGATLSEPELIYVGETCAKNEVFSRCQANPDCEKSCDNIDIWESILCDQTKTCLSGCICEEGYVRDVNGGLCVLENSCPRVRH